MKQCPVMRFVPPMIKDIRTAKNYCSNANRILNHMDTVCRNLETQMFFYSTDSTENVNEGKFVIIFQNKLSPSSTLEISSARRITR